MSADISIFHSSELDDPRLLAEGFYVGAFPPGSDGAGAVDLANVRGPYLTKHEAMSAMIERVWL